MIHCTAMHDLLPQTADGHKQSELCVSAATWHYKLIHGNNQVEKCLTNESDWKSGSRTEECTRSWRTNEPQLCAEKIDFNGSFMNLLNSLGNDNH